MKPVIVGELVAVVVEERTWEDRQTGKSRRFFVGTADLLHKGPSGRGVSKVNLVGLASAAHGLSEGKVYSMALTEYQAAGKDGGELCRVDIRDVKLT